MPNAAHRLVLQVILLARFQLFLPSKGGGEDVAYAQKGKEILIHTVTDGNGMSLANRTTPANGSEKDQVMPLLDSVKVKHLRHFLDTFSFK
ncbi:MAG: hypothetical protein V7L04_32615 [Nostoc sp.]|uniref:hypothetical protein n=1 Tax=Nostoc sp. TaxID=1180 RepID=UPI002FF7D383